MRFYFHKTNRVEFDRQVDRIWSLLPERGPCVADIDGHKRAMPDSIREYYFGFVVTPFCKDQGMGSVEAHELFKSMLSELYGEEEGEIYHVFGYASDMPQEKKEAFIRDVRSILFHELGITTEPWRGCE